MSYIACKTCRGTGFVKRIKPEFCINNPERISSHICYKCENIQEKLKGQYMLCQKCQGDGYFVKSPKPTQLSSFSV